MNFFAKSIGVSARIEICSCTYKKNICTHSPWICNINATGHGSSVLVDCTTGEECSSVVLEECCRR